jgi:hypothetical protein
MSMEQLVSLLSSVLGPALGAVGAYVAIRSDLAAIKARIEGHGDAITRAHERIDDILNKR